MLCQSNGRKKEGSYQLGGYNTVFIKDFDTIGNYKGNNEHNPKS